MQELNVDTERRVPFRVAISRIRKANFHPIVKYVLRRQHLNWNDVRAWKVTRDFEIFFALTDEADFVLVPSPDVEEFWCACIVHTRFYLNELCSPVFGRIIHYHPRDGDEEDNHQKSADYLRTADLIKSFAGYEF